MKQADAVAVIQPLGKLRQADLGSRAGGQLSKTPPKHTATKNWGGVRGRGLPSGLEPRVQSVGPWAAAHVKERLTGSVCLRARLPPPGEHLLQGFLLWGCSGLRVAKSSVEWTEVGEGPGC